MTTAVSLTLMALCLLLSAYFSATETAFSSLSTAKLRALAERGDRRAERGDRRAELALRLHGQYDRLISTILIGNNIVNIATASLGTLLFVHRFGDAGASLSTVVVTLAVLIFGEISPKSVARDCAERFACFSAPMLRFLMWAFTPLNFLFSQWKRLLSRLFRLRPESRLSQAELLMLVEGVQQEGSIDRGEGELLKNAIQFTGREAGDILIHRVDLAAIPLEASREEIAARFAETRYSRLIVYRDSIDNILGVLHQKDFYIGQGITEKPLSELLTPVVFTLESEPIRHLLTQLQKAKTHVAVVVDEHGGTCGIVTMEDILEELVGEIWDEHDEVELPLRRLSPDCFLVDAGMDLEDFQAQFPLAKDSEMVSVGGWVMERFGRVPEVGDRFSQDGWEIQVTQAERHRVAEIQLRREAAVPV